MSSAATPKRKADEPSDERAAKRAKEITDLYAAREKRAAKHKATWDVKCNEPGHQDLVNSILQANDRDDVFIMCMLPDEKMITSIVRVNELRQTFSMETVCSLIDDGPHSEFRRPIHELQEYEEPRNAEEVLEFLRSQSFDYKNGGYASGPFAAVIIWALTDEEDTEDLEYEEESKE